MDTKTALPFFVMSTVIFGGIFYLGTEVFRGLRRLYPFVWINL